MVGEEVRALTSDLTVRDVLAGAEVRHADHGWPLAEVELLDPVQPAGTIYAIGLNYAKHVEETGATKPEQPIVFVKVVGSSGQIGGYCVADDVTARDLQRRESQWTRAKGADTFCPYGPWVTTAEEVPDPGNLDLKTWVNGELRQDSNTGDLIFGCQEIVKFISETCTLLPGDLILTGTPNGVGMGLDPPQFLQSGDVVRIEIARLGAIEHQVL